MGSGCEAMGKQVAKTGPNPTQNAKPKTDANMDFIYGPFQTPLRLGSLSRFQLFKGGVAVRYLPR